MKEFSWTLRGIVGAGLGGVIYMVIGSGFEIDWIPFVAIGAALGLILGMTTWEKLAAIVLVGIGLWLINPMIAIAGIGVLGGLFLLSRFKGGTGNSATHATQAQHQGDHAAEPSHAPASNGNGKGNAIRASFSLDNGEVNIQRYNERDYRLRRMEQLQDYSRNSDDMIASMAREELRLLAAQCLVEQGGDPNKHMGSLHPEHHGEPQQTQVKHTKPPLVARSTRPFIDKGTNPLLDLLKRR